jgi:hypothetical protein
LKSSFGTERRSSDSAPKAFFNLLSVVSRLWRTSGVASTRPSFVCLKEIY